MTKYSLINVTSETNGKVNGYWIQDKTGSLEDAIKLAKETNEINGNKLDIAVTPYISSPVAILEFWTNLERLN